MWAFGIVLWEIGSLGNESHRSVAKGDEELVNYQTPRAHNNLATSYTRITTWDEINRVLCLLTGAFPYPTISNHALLQYLISGKRLERPDNVSTDLYNLMLKCWAESPSDRPSFEEILTKLEPKQQTYLDFNEIDPNYVFPPTIDDLAPGQIQKVKQQEANSQPANSATIVE